MRFLKLYASFISQHFKRLMEYKIDFLTGAISFMIDQIANLVFIWVIFDNIEALGSWNYQEIIFIYGFSLLPKGLDHLLTDNLWKVAWWYVRKGEFDKYLTRPLNPLLHVIMEDFQFDALGEFIVGIYLVTSSSIKIGVSYGFIKVLLLIVSVIFGMLIFTSIKILVSSLALKIKSSGSILQIFYMTSDFARYPIDIYNKLIKNIITYMIPFAFTSYFPASYFLGKTDNVLFNIGGVVVAGSVFLTLGILAWNRGLKAYESAGS